MKAVKYAGISLHWRDFSRKGMTCGKKKFDFLHITKEINSIWMNSKRNFSQKMYPKFSSEKFWLLEKYTSKKKLRCMKVHCLRPFKYVI